MHSATFSTTPHMLAASVYRCFCHCASRSACFNASSEHKLPNFSHSRSQFCWTHCGVVDWPHARRRNKVHTVGDVVLVLSAEFRAMVVVWVVDDDDGSPNSRQSSSTRRNRINPSQFPTVIRFSNLQLLLGILLNIDARRRCC